MSRSNKPRLNTMANVKHGIWRLTFPEGYAPTGNKHVEFASWFDTGWETVARLLQNHNEARNAQ